jgi:hypothetical protein
MRWLWFPRLGSKVFEDVSRLTQEVVPPDYSGSSINPLAEYGMKISTEQGDLLLFAKYADITKLAHRQRKRRKRYASYRVYSQRTHHRRPTIFAPDTVEQVAVNDMYSTYVRAFNTASIHPQDSPLKWLNRESNRGDVLAELLPRSLPSF